jgi:hypothetical protein
VSKMTQMTSIVGAAALACFTPIASPLADLAETARQPAAPSENLREAPPAPTIHLPADPAQLDGDLFQGALRDTFDLVRDRRYGEALIEIQGLAAQLPAGSAIWQAALCSALTISIRAGQPYDTKAIDKQLEPFMADPLRPPAGCVTQIAIARNITGLPQPLRVPPGLAELLGSVRGRRSTTVQPVFSSSKTEGSSK